MVRRTTTASATTTATTTTLNNANAAPVKKKKGRPSLIDLQNRALLQQQQQQQQNPNSQSHFPQPNPNRRSRSARRIPNLPARFIDGSDSDDHSIDGRQQQLDDDDDDDDINNGVDDDDDDERIKKKVKLVVQFPNSNNKSINNSIAAQQDVKGLKATDNDNGTRRMVGGALETGPTPSTSTSAAATATTTTSTPLPDKKLLLLILDKLQKKDTRGVFAEPVDPEELPDYHEIIEKPMDFETVRKKLMGGLYSIVEQFEDDIYLICSNAMQYNSSSTIFHRQARAIQELAKKEFETLKQDGGVFELPSKPRRGRPPGSRNLKKLLESSPPDRAVRESSEDATPASRDVTPASREEDTTKSGSYNLRKGPSLYRFPRYLENCFDYSASGSKSMAAKYGKKTCGIDEYRRDTYFLPSESDSGQDQQLRATFGGHERQIVAVGFASEHSSYARSLAQFAAGLGPEVWSIASKKIQSVLPPGVEFGPGWVGETKVSSTQLFSLPERSVQSQNSFRGEPLHPSISAFRNSNSASKPPTSCPEKSIESRELCSNVIWSSTKGSNGVVGPNSSLHIQNQGSVFPRMNGFSGSFAPGSQFQEAGMPTSSSSSFINPHHGLDSSSFDASRSFPGVINSENDMVDHGMPYWQNLSVQESWDRPYPMELNRGFQASSSKSTNLPISSPPQLDLVLQL